MAEIYAKVFYHAPQGEAGGNCGPCHGFEKDVKVKTNETPKQAVERVRVSELNRIQKECGEACKCEGGKPVFHYDGAYSW